MLIHEVHSRNRPDLEEGRGGRRALREYIREDAGVNQPDTEGEAGDGPEDANQETTTVT